MHGDGARDVQTASNAGAGIARASIIAPSALQDLRDEWGGLSANAVEPNPFYGPALLLPALDAFGNEGAETVIVRDAAGRLIGLAPIAPQKGYSRLPVPYIATWMHPHCFFASPLVRPGSERAFFRAFFALAERRGAFLRLRHLDADGLLFAAALSVAAETGRLASPSARYRRALLKGGWQTEAVLAASFDGKKRKELRRLRNRLGDHGAVSFTTLSRAGDVAAWTETFLALEAGGWKGRAGTALASDPAAARFFSAAVAAAFGEGMVRFHRLDVGGEIIAMIVNFVEGGAGYSFKIAHDEAYARYSPGLMIEIDMMKALEGAAGLAFIDSCAKADHPMIDRLWRERRTISALNISRRDAPSKALFRLLTMLERVSEAARKPAMKTAEPDGDDDL